MLGFANATYHLSADPLDVLPIGLGHRRQILIALDGFLAAQFAATHDKDDCRHRDDATDDKSESAFVFVHDNCPTRAAGARFRDAPSLSLKPGEKPSRNQAISWMGTALRAAAMSPSYSPRRI